MGSGDRYQVERLSVQSVGLGHRRMRGRWLVQVVGENIFGIGHCKLQRRVQLCFCLIKGLLMTV